ncbi:hypothetical protein ABZY44_03280 [Streptomyces sp. NPDC006544]|uniref:hypothetical protein n=1 Tax=Streptomyces sp. NPDC006544 TaxID=3154583 RepID=UPI0033BF3736
MDHTKRVLAAIALAGAALTVTGTAHADGSPLGASLDSAAANLGSYTTTGTIEGGPDPLHSLTAPVEALGNGLR